MIIDALIAIFLIYFGFQGLKKGLIRIIVDMAAVLGGAYLALIASPQLSVYLEALLPNRVSSLIPVASFVLLWAACFWGIIGVGYMLEKVLCPMILKPINYTLGLIFGVLKGFIYALPIILILSMADASQTNGSVLLPPVKQWMSEKNVTIESLLSLMDQIKSGQTPIQEPGEVFRSDVIYPESENILSIFDQDDSSR